MHSHSASFRDSVSKFSLNIGPSINTVLRSGRKEKTKVRLPKKKKKKKRTVNNDITSSRLQKSQTLSSQVDAMLKCDGYLIHIESRDVAIRTS